MVIIGQAINVAITLALVVLSWVMPRRFGALGLIGAHLLVLYAWLAMGAVALAFGVWDGYEDGLAIIGLAIQAFLFNCAMLPLSLTATWRWSNTNTGGGR